MIDNTIEDLVQAIYINAQNGNSVTFATQAIAQAILDALPDDKDIVPQKPGDMESFMHNQFSIGYNQAISDMQSAIKPMGEEQL